METQQVIPEHIRERCENSNRTKTRTMATPWLLSLLKISHGRVLYKQTDPLEMCM